MSNKITIKKVQGKILTYQKNGKTYRLYDNILTDDFIKEYVSNGTPEELTERKKLFNFPNKSENTKPDISERPNTTSTLESFKGAQAKPQGKKK